MIEYITKEQAIDEVWDAFTSHDDPDLGRVIEENINRLPPADVAPVVRGRPLEDENGWPVCGCCGGSLEDDDQYCPYCGAKMEEE